MFSHSDILAAATMGVEGAFTCTLPQPQCKSSVHRGHIPPAQSALRGETLLKLHILPLRAIEACWAENTKNYSTKHSHVLPTVASQD
jgi:hypothetical protein